MPTKYTGVARRRHRTEVTRQVGSKIGLRVSIGDEKKPGVSLPLSLPRDAIAT
ncbi:MAG: hypothetical protein KME50_37915 [Nostoc desertorum CM1-VF14]|nr:hypothetical protein [Nostoc desertorum CM1-VF14]